MSFEEPQMLHQSARVSGTLLLTVLLALAAVLTSMNRVQPPYILYSDTSYANVYEDTKGTLFPLPLTQESENYKSIVRVKVFPLKTARDHAQRRGMSSRAKLPLTKTQPASDLQFVRADINSKQSSAKHSETVRVHGIEEDKAHIVNTLQTLFSPRKKTHLQVLSTSETDRDSRSDMHDDDDDSVGWKNSDSQDARLQREADAADALDDADAEAAEANGDNASESERQMMTSSGGE